MSKAMEKERTVFTIQFLLEKIPPGDTVAHDFITSMVQRLFEEYGDMSAKGGDQRTNTTINEHTKHAFEAKDDQAMVSHLLNGVFPTLRLLSILESERLGPTFSNIQRRVYVLSYLMHDFDKILGHDAAHRQMPEAEQVTTQDREHIEHAKSIINSYLQRCHADDFFPDYVDYLEEITYLAVNTQRRWGTHLHTYSWKFRLRERQVLVLRDLCTYSDLIAYLVPNPAIIVFSDETSELREIIQRLSEDKLEFCYHQLREVRGLLTNVVNTGIIHLMTDDHDGIWPYLFFSDGVVYIKRKSLSLSITTQQMVEAVQTQLQRSCANVIKQDAPGFKFSIQGIAKHPGYYFEFLSLEEYVTLLQKCTIGRTNNDTFSGTWVKMRQLQKNGEIPATVSLDIQPEGHNASIMTRFLSVVFVTLLGLLDDKTQQELHEQVKWAVVQQLELTAYWEQATAIPNKGGVDYRWFWLAACYLQDHPGLNISGEERSLETIFSTVLQLVLRLAGDALRTRLPQKYLQYLPAYLESIVELPQSIRAGAALPDFAAEFERYEQSKSRKRQLLCTLCNSAYPTEEQADSAVLFQPYVYKNKLSLYAGKSAGGICVLCSLELMLRQILLKGQLQLTGSKFEAQKTKYIAVYPNFFFTPETGALISGVINQLRNINFFTVRNQLGEHPLEIADLFRLDAFAAASQPELQVVEDPVEDEDEAETEVEEDHQKVLITDRSYIKYEPEEYPGLFLFGMRASKDDNDTASWAMPAFLALSLPLVTGTKVVISEMSLPLFASGRDFLETVVFDASHPYLDYVLEAKRIRVNRLLATLRRLTYIYRVNIDTYAKKGKPEWGHLSAIARALETDPLYLFHYLRRQDRINSVYRGSIVFYLRIYECITGETMLETNNEGKESRIAQCVDRYAAFYRGGYQSHSILKPVDIVARAIINSPLNIKPEDLLWQMQGELRSWLDRVRNGSASGWASFRGKAITEEEQPAIRAFVEYFYDEIFQNYCQSERGILRSRINRFKDGCEAYYLYHYASQKMRRQEQATEQDQEAELTGTE
jgi:CRISPR-associated protein Csc3